MLIGMKNRGRFSQPQLEALNIEIIRRRSSLRTASEVTSEIINRHSSDQLLNAIDRIE